MTEIIQSFNSLNRNNKSKVGILTLILRQGFYRVILCIYSERHNTLE